MIPSFLSLLTIPITFHRSKSIQFCKSCHLMKPFFEDLHEPTSPGLASKHYQHRWISKDQCSVCHTDYRFLGTVDAKWRGLKHLAIFYLHPTSKTRGLYKPYPNQNCLQCHGDTKRFMENEIHKSQWDEIHTNQMRCLDCHRPIHPFLDENEKENKP